MKIYTGAFIILLVLISILIIKKRMQYWIFSYLSSYFKRRTYLDIFSPIDILFCIVDHFEPGYGEADSETEKRRLDLWVERYPLLASKHRDYDGKPPQHTWFFPPHYDKQNHLERLVRLCQQGYGEIELHFHHNRIPPYPDNSQTFEKKIRDCIKSYSRFGIFPEDKTGKNRYGFIHGDWALDNSRGNKFCGINDEIQILARTGCYADFTFPSQYKSQPRKINTFYYAKDDPLRPKSYDTGQNVKVDSKADGDLMIIQGTLGIRLVKRIQSLFMAIEDSDISNSNPPTRNRIDFWVKHSIFIENKPNIRFIKLHTHGAWEGCAEALLGKAAEDMYSYLENRYNDGKNFRLHYVTAREMYNIIKTIETGKKGSLSDFRDFMIPKPEYINL
ncbi:MAG: hypothetical protein WC549_04850 [Actinomycetota bacterium]